MAATTEYPGVAVITGAASGIGCAVAQAFVAAGCTKIALIDIDESGLVETKRLVQDVQSAVDALTLTCDVESDSSVDATFAAVVSHFSRLDYLANCAGIAVMGMNSTTTAVSDFDKQTNVNYRGVWLCSRAALKIMSSQSVDTEAYSVLSKLPEYRAQRGSIVNISSSGALRPMPLSSIYSTSKAAINSITKSDALDFASQKIRINAVMPGVIETPMTTRVPEIRQMLEEKVIPNLPNQRWGKPQEVADVVVFLSGNKASLVTGGTWTVDGGYTI